MPAAQERRHGCIGLAALALGGLYLVAPTFGVFEFLPDHIPFVGNLDEAGATALALWGLRLMGIDLLRFSGKGAQRAGPPRG